MPAITGENRVAG